MDKNGQFPATEIALLFLNAKYKAGRLKYFHLLKKYVFLIGRSSEVFFYADRPQKTGIKFMLFIGLSV